MGMTQRELTRLMSSDPNTVASLLERMETAGWIERKPHEADRRAHRIQILPTGKRKFTHVRKLAAYLQTEVLSVLPEGDREKFLEQLTLVGEMCRKLADENAKPAKPVVEKTVETEQD